MKQIEKKQYWIPRMELLTLQDEDVLTASAGFDGEEHFFGRSVSGEGDAV